MRRFLRFLLPRSSPPKAARPGIEGIIDALREFHRSQVRDQKMIRRLEERMRRRAENSEPLLRDLEARLAHERELGRLYAETVALGNLRTLAEHRNTIAEQRVSDDTTPLSAGGWAPPPPAPEDSIDGLTPLERTQKRVLLEYLRMTNFNQAETAKLLGVRPNTVIVWMRKYGITPPWGEPRRGRKPKKPGEPGA